VCVCVCVCVCEREREREGEGAVITQTIHHIYHSSLTLSARSTLLVLSKGTSITKRMDEATVWKFRDRILAGTSNLCIFQNVHTGIGSYPASYSMGTKTSFSEGKANAEIYNEWRYI